MHCPSLSLDLKSLAHSRKGMPVSWGWTDRTVLDHARGSWRRLSQGIRHPWPVSPSVRLRGGADSIEQDSYNGMYMRTAYEPHNVAALLRSHVQIGGILPGLSSPSRLLESLCPRIEASLERRVDAQWEGLSSAQAQGVSNLMYLAQQLSQQIDPAWLVQQAQRMFRLFSETQGHIESEIICSESLASVLRSIKFHRNESGWCGALEVEWKVLYESLFSLHVPGFETCHCTSKRILSPDLVEKHQKALLSLIRESRSFFSESAPSELLDTLQQVCLDPNIACTCCCFGKALFAVPACSRCVHVRTQKPPSSSALSGAL